MKSIVFAAALTVASLFAFGSASAQTSGGVKVNIPFSFTIGESVVPADTYIISAQPNSPYVRFQNAAGTRTVSFLSVHDDLTLDGSGKLVFHRYGDQYFLTRISQPHSSANLHFVPSRAEKRAKTRVELAGLPIGDPIIVALN